MNSCLAVNKAAMSHALAFLRGRGVSRESEPGGTTELTPHRMLLGTFDLAK